MTFIPQIYIIKENGFIENTKFQNELDLVTLKQGNNITSFYNETYPLYNILYKNSDNHSALFQDGKLTFLSQEDLIEKIQLLYALLINQVASSNVNDLLNDYKNADGTIDRQSVFQEYLQNLSWTTNYEFTPVLEDFSLDKYRNIANELHFLSDNLDSSKLVLGHFLKSSINGFNTFLAYDGIVTDFSSGLFSTHRDEETNEVKISFSDAVDQLYYAQRICNATVQIGQKKEDFKKPKF